MSVASNTKALLIALTLTGAAVSAPAVAGDVEEDFGFSPRVGRQVTVTTVSRRPYYGRPVYEDDDFEPRYRRHYWGRGDYRPVYGRPVYAGGYGGGCRLIIKKRENAWGDVVVKRIRVCD